MKLQFPRLHAFLLGKAASYRCNAYDDAAIAAEIICYLQTGQMPQGASHGAHPIAERAAHLIEHSPADGKEQRLVVQAYTLFHLNGYADLMYARFIEDLAGLNPPLRHTIYGDGETCPVNLWFWIPPLVKKDVSAIQTYAREVAGIELTLPYCEIMREVVRVQEANMASNQHTRQHIKRCLHAPTGHPKADTLRALADELAHPGIFIFSAARTQSAASNWDRLVVWVLRRRFASGL